MSELDHLTDEDLNSMNDKIDMLTEQLELSKARTQVLLDILGDARPDYDTLNSDAKVLVSMTRERAEMESQPPRFDPPED